MESTWKCAHADCGRENPMSAAYCEQCGRTPPPPRTLREAAARERSRSILNFYIYIWVPVLIVIIVFYLIAG